MRGVELRPHQGPVVEQVLEHFRRGVRVVFLDAPTGSGKTFIAEAVRRRMGTSGIYSCHSRNLQRQFLRDFPLARLIEGRSNYRTALDPRRHCGQCRKRRGVCPYCPSVKECPYVLARARAEGAAVAVGNHAYFATCARHGQGGRLFGRRLAVWDEADTLPEVLAGTQTLHIGARTVLRYGLTYPRTKTGKDRRWLEWLSEVRERLLTAVASVAEIEEEERIRRWLGVVDELLQYTEQELYDRYVYEGETSYRGEPSGPQKLQPVHVLPHNLWTTAQYHLLMSATLISPRMMARELHIPSGEWKVVRCEHTVPVSQRPIYAVRGEALTRGTEREHWPRVLSVLREVLARHRGLVLIHTVSRARTKRVCEALYGLGRRPVFSYEEAGDRVSVVARWKRSGNGILVAHSLDRGLDAPECEAVVVVKVPFPNLGDPVVQARRYGPGGREWYLCKTVESLVQMTGRHVRSSTDTGTSYILDGSFVRIPQHLFPQWWWDAVRWKRTLKEVQHGMV